MNQNLPVIKCNRIELSSLIKMYSIGRKMLNLQFAELPKSFFNLIQLLLKGIVVPRGCKVKKIIKNCHSNLTRGLS